MGPFRKKDLRSFLPNGAVVTPEPHTVGRAAVYRRHQPRRAGRAGVSSPSGSLYGG